MLLNTLTIWFCFQLSCEIYPQTMESIHFHLQVQITIKMR